jgi:hypothetical protein
MKVVGIITETKQMRYVVLSGSISAPSRGAETLRTIPYPPNIDTGAGLSAMLKTLAGLVSSLQPCRISVLQSVPSRTGNRSMTRPVIEALIKLACNQVNQDCIIVHPNSLRAKEKKFVSIVGDSPENTLNGGLAFSPALSKDAHLVAWMGLEQ